MDLEQALNSIKKFYYELWPVKIYSNRVPVEIETPSIAYTQPDQTDGIFSKQEYETFNILRVTIHEATDQLAYGKALELSEAIRKNKYKVPVVDATGLNTEEHVAIESIAASLVGEHEAQITITYAIQKPFN